MSPLDRMFSVAHVLGLTPLESIRKRKMAVKQHDQADNQNQLDVTLLLKYIHLLNQGYTPTHNELIVACQELVEGLSRLETPRESDRLAGFLEQLQVADKFIQAIVENVTNDDRIEIMFASIKALYTKITDTSCVSCPAASILLQLAQGKFLSSGVLKLITEGTVEDGSGNTDDSGLRITLSYLYRWVSSWQCTPVLSEFVSTYIKSLEEKEQYNVLVEVTEDNIGNLFDALLSPMDLGQAVAPILLHILAAQRHSAHLLDKIACRVPQVLETLADDSSQSSRQVLQDFVDIMYTMISIQYETAAKKGQRALELVKEKYCGLMTLLDTHITLKSYTFLSIPLWNKVGMLPGLYSIAPFRKLGLLNLGNTCYMNSVLQALFMTKPFSNAVIREMYQLPYWSKLSHLFVMMTFSLRPRLDPTDFFNWFKPPHFIRENQHDSSEFLGYLLELLHSQEKFRTTFQKEGSSSPKYHTTVKDGNNSGDCPGSADLPTESAVSCSSASADTALSNDLALENIEAAGTSSSVSYKRSNVNNYAVPPKKRCYIPNGSSVRRTSHPTPPVPTPSSSISPKETSIQGLFGGVQVTKIKCTNCSMVSVHRDKFRDLQLAIPDKPIKPRSSVQTLLEFYCTKEDLADDNRYACTNCAGLYDAERSVNIETPPKFFIIVLKNFRFNVKQQTHSKLFHDVHLDKYIGVPTALPGEPRAMYRLYSVIVHAGNSLDSGHYYTYAEENERWYRFNDDRVELCSELEFNSLSRTTTPYILFYRGIDVEEGVKPTLDTIPIQLADAVRASNKEFIELVQSYRGPVTRHAALNVTHSL